MGLKKQSGHCDDYSQLAKISLCFLKLLRYVSVQGIFSFRSLLNPFNSHPFPNL